MSNATRRWRRGIVGVVLAITAGLSLSSTSCKSSYCQGYKDACMKDCRQSPVAGKECSAVCEERLKTHPAYQSCLEQK